MKFAFNSTIFCKALSSSPLPHRLGDGKYVCMYEICFYSCLLSYYMLINVDYTITYFLPIPSTVPRTRARSELLNVSLVPPRVEFYTALPVSIVGRY